jgi:hypothetical protein
MAIAADLDTKRATPAVMFGFDPLDRARYLASRGQARLATLVAHHTGAKYDAALRGLRERTRHSARPTMTACPA